MTMNATREPPPKPGLYQVINPIDYSLEYAYWSGDRWGFAYANKRWANLREWRHDPDATQNKLWVIGSGEDVK